MKRLNMPFFLLFVLSIQSIAQNRFVPDSPYKLSGNKITLQQIEEKLKASAGRTWSTQDIKTLENEILENNRNIITQLKKKDEEINFLVELSKKINSLHFLSKSIEASNGFVLGIEAQQKTYETGKSLSVIQYNEIDSLKELVRNKTKEITISANKLAGEKTAIIQDKIKDDERTYLSIKNELNGFLQKNSVSTNGKADQDLVNDANKLISEQLRNLNLDKMKIKSDEFIAVFNIPVSVQGEVNENIAKKTIEINNILESQFAKVDGFFAVDNNFNEIKFKEAGRAASDTWLYLSPSVNDREYLHLVQKLKMDDYLVKTKKVRNNFNENIEGVLIEMVYVEGGEYLMGSPQSDSESQADERPVHTVNVADFYIGRYEVTQEVWSAVMGANPSINKGCVKCPVENISLNDAQQFINQLNQKTGKNYRLPSEAEWEYAARGGQKSMGYLYAGGNNVKKVANYECKAPTKVGKKDPNELGLYDMSGNVWEWVLDRWHDDYTNAPADGSAWTEGDSKLWVNRGGSCGYHERYQRIGNRNDDHPDKGRDVVGIRLVLSAD